MQFAVFGKRESVDDFIRRTHPGASAADRRRVEEALLRANPILRQPAASRDASTIVVLPDVSGVTPGGVEPTNVAASLAKEIRGVTSELQALLSERGDRRDSRLKAAVADLKTREMKQVKDPDVRKRLASMAEDLGRQQKELRAVRKAQEEALTALERDLDTFIRHFGRR